MLKLMANGMKRDAACKEALDLIEWQRGPKNGELHRNNS
jgi:hypothetical protein